MLINLEQLRDSYLKTLDKKTNFQRTLSKGLVVATADAKLPEVFSAENLENEYQIQSILRQAYDKPGVNTGTIGPHPDYAHLAFTGETERGWITTIFLDIKKSTRLCLLYSPEEVLDIKNSVLKSASEIVRAFDGHVHRFMGDALIAFFGNKLGTKEQAVLDSLNCCQMLTLFMNQAVIPALESRGYEASNIKFRIGIDFAPEEDTVWGSYGYSSVSEITPTSFFVDCASKLQSMAPSGKVVMGKNLIDILDFPDLYRKNLKGTNSTLIEHLLPNYTDKLGKPLNYKIWLLDHEKFMQASPIGTEIKHLTGTPGVVHHALISYWCEINKGQIFEKYASLSKTLQTGVALRFIVMIPNQLFTSFPDKTMKIEFIKKNNGAHAAKKEDDKESLCEEKIINCRDHVRINGSTGIYQFRHDGQETTFNGIHTMRVKVSIDGITIFSDWIGLAIGRPTNGHSA